ncbi:MAG: acyl-CoA thioesterase [Gemmatimonadales bacterium]|nr:acyl-CoA thioesterase [Gemmatimonadales bacterium]
MSHSIQIKIRGYHLDFYGHVNNARYLEFLEEARWAHLEQGVDLGFWKERGLGFVVASLTINYRRPAGLGTVIEVRSHVDHLGGKSGVIHQDVVDSVTGSAIADADVTFVVVDMRTGKAVALEGEIRQQLLEPKEEAGQTPEGEGG